MDMQSFKISATLCMCGATLLLISQDVRNTKISDLLFHSGMRCIFVALGCTLWGIIWS